MLATAGFTCVAFTTGALAWFGPLYLHSGFSLIDGNQEISEAEYASSILCLHDLSSLSPKLRYFARSGPPFVIRSVLIRWGWLGLQILDLSERENGLWGRERGDCANR